MSKQKEETPEIDLDALGQDVIETNDLTLLYKYDLLLRKIKSDAFIKLAKQKGNVEEEPIKARIDMSSGIHDICIKRQQELIEKEKASNRVNSRFRFLAKQTLAPDVFRRIAEEADKSVG